MGNNSCYSYFIKLAFAFLFIFAGAVSSQNNTVCPFNYLYHLGDGVTDIGNNIRVLPGGPLNPATRLPYGRTFPGYPTGRWCDGLIDFDYAAADFGFPNIVPYLAPNSSTSNGVIFSVARSPVLDRTFFALRGILIPSYAVSLNSQLNWFKTHLRSVCASTADCRNRLANSLILLGDIEANDVGYALTQGKSINEVRTNYVSRIIQTQINVLRVLIRMGASRIIVPGSSPIGCFPYILTQFPSNDPDAYDQFGCLKSVNDLITYKNNILQQALANITSQFPQVTYADYGLGVLQYINQTLAGPYRNNTLRACCGIGGRYNYNSTRFCGSVGVPVCPDPNNYIFWDGLHLTQEAQLRIEKNLIQPALAMFNCTT